ncbi:MAG: hypothetical protein LQ350_008084 [Teloschistes chrysophthalmus]|nr:MAG: hypothetical protein LQ350_008084 [Niorma chrysophthalma]
MTDRSELKIENGQERSAQSILSRTTKGATYLILVQVGSRALTFLVNQILLRFLSPELLGISTQLELYSTSVLFFARESLRVALQREDVEGPEAFGEEDGKNHKVNHKFKTQDRKAQEVVNLSYIAIGLGLPLAYIFASLYIRNADTPVLTTPYIQASLNTYLLATILELCSEPCFALAQQQMLYGVRASAETLATFTRCLLTCGIAVWASKADVAVGALPFAIGQLGYAAILNVVYLTQLTPSGIDRRQSLFLKPIAPSSPSLLLDRFPLSRLNLAFNIYAQSIFKHILTTGDSLLVAAFTSLQSQGAYTLAANYGGLVARMVFQPVEESTRTLLGRLLHQSAHGPKATDNTHAISISERREQVDQAANYLRFMLRFYSIISTIIVAVGPSLAPLLLRFIAGSRWSDSEAPSVLSAYCYYIPLLAINGILEAFVSAAATPAELRVQSAWMVAFSAAFAVTGFLVLKAWDQGAQGLVFANAVNMTCRIIWSWQFTAGHLRDRGIAFRAWEVVPKFSVIILAIGTSWYLSSIGHNSHESIRALAIGAAITGFSVLLM